MQIHELKPKHKNKTKKRVGRGGKKGTYSGKGMKGQGSRAGRKMVPIIREIIKRYPKLRGYRRFVMDDSSAVVNLEVLEKTFEAGEIVNAENLLKKGIVSKIKGKAPEVKILGTGKLTKKLIIEGCKISKSAKEAVEKAGGAIK
jgi:large subunit ribosomal protein L15